ncbi:MAG: hypothetical protein KF832_09000 [Caldilineaceae bacterium]|nr:hypothetical protein [Caldilineaceae bacterium]
MTTRKPCALVLWGDHCDEVAAAIFVTTLRTAGLRVWVVGVSGRRIGGMHGLCIQPDMTPYQALVLAQQVSALVVPCPDLLLTRFLNDPYVDALLKAVHTQALILAPTAPTYTLGRYQTNVLLYPSHEVLVPFVRKLAATLSASPAWLIDA